MGKFGRKKIGMICFVRRVASNFFFFIFIIRFDVKSRGQPAYGTVSGLTARDCVDELLRVIFRVTKPIDSVDLQPHFSHTPPYGIDT